MARAILQRLGVAEATVAEVQQLIAQSPAHVRRGHAARPRRPANARRVLRDTCSERRGAARAVPAHHRRRHDHQPDVDDQLEAPHARRAVLSPPSAGSPASQPKLSPRTATARASVLSLWAERARPSLHRALRCPACPSATSTRTSPSRSSSMRCFARRRPGARRQHPAGPGEPPLLRAVGGRRRSPRACSR